MDKDVSDLMAAARHGDQSAQQHLFDQLYAELRLCAHRQLRGSAQEMLSTTALVNETYLKLATSSNFDRDDRRHFMSLAARVMRQVLIDMARRGNADKRSDAALKITLDDNIAETPELSCEVLALDQALSTLGQVDERAARVVQLHFFAGLSFSAIAELEGLALATVMRDWRAARTLLAHEMG